MNTININERFGDAAAGRLATLLTEPPLSEAFVDVDGSATAFSLADPDRLLGSLMGVAIGEAAGEPVEGRSSEWIERRCGVIGSYLNNQPSAGSDTALALLTLDAVLIDPSNHPQALSQLITQSAIVSRGQTLDYTRDRLRAGVAWWSAAPPDSAGTAGPARCVTIGLLFAGKPERAAYEAAISCSVTHSHPAALAAAAAVAAAVSTAAAGTPLDAKWMQAAADVADLITTDRRVSGRIRLAAALLGQDRRSSLDLIGTHPVSWETVPAALWCAANASTSVEAIFTAVNAGGDTDTIASMAGALVGAAAGTASWPAPLTQINGMSQIQAAASRVNAPPTPSASNPVEPNVQPSGAVHVSFLLDRSGSMQSLTNDVIGGFNTFVANQATVPGKCTFTAAQFDGHEPYEVLYDQIPIEQVTDLDSQRYQPRGTTPLFDALATLITNAEKRGSTAGIEEEQIVVVFTDGYENSSRNWNRDQVFTLIEQKKAEGWTFVFMGANQDAYAQGGGVGVDAGNVQNYRGDGFGMRQAWSSVDRAVDEYRRSSTQERLTRRGDFFSGNKEAEDDHLTR